MQKPNYLERHFNVYWLRPASALWDAIASDIISQFSFISPSLDLGSGNGIFSFITAGGAFSIDYDWYRNSNPTGFWDNRDIYDTFLTLPQPKYIVEKPRYLIDFALDRKINLLKQTEGLNLYRHTKVADADHRLPFEDNSFQTVFSNILYWLKSPESSFKEVWRILRPGGHALLCLQDPKYQEYCPSENWQEMNSELLRLLNTGRSQRVCWRISLPQLKELTQKTGFKIAYHSYYLSPLTLKIWDIGLRPLSPLLIKMVQKFNESDRAEIKQEWMETLQPFLRELYELDKQNQEQGGFHFVCLEKI